MKVQKKNFDYDVNQCSPVVKDYVRVEKRTEKGEVIPVWEEFDSMAYQKSLGPVDNWSLSSLIDAGVDPRFGISTGYPSRLEGVSEINSMDIVVNSIIEDSKSE